MKAHVWKALSVLGIAVLVAGCGSASKPAAPTETAAPPPPAAATPVLATVIAPPVPVPATDGKVHLAYELQVTNAMGGDVTLVSLAVKAGGRPLLTLAGDKLAYWMRALGAGTKPTTTLGAGQAGIVWLDVVVDNGTPAPTDLSHTVVVNVAKPMPPLIPATVTENVAPVTVSTHKPAVISPPLSGPNWLDANSCCDMTAHRMAMNPLDGGLWAAERFAIDYIQRSPDGTLFKGPQDKTESYPYFGTDIHAVADGPVVGVVDGLPEQVPGTTPTGLPLDQYGGNHVVQDISGGGTEKTYAFYAHLKTGSVKVKVGDQLTAGQVLGNLGNTGNSDAPHLHFQVMSTPDPLRSNGLPFVFKDFTLDGRLASMDLLDPLLTGKPAPLAPGSGARPEAGVSPVVLDVMTYGNG